MTPQDEGTEPAHICRTCASNLVQATGRRRTAPGCWEVRLHCPDCGACATVLLDEVSLLVFDDIQAEAAETLASWIRRLAAPNPSPATDGAVRPGPGSPGTATALPAPVPSYPLETGATAPRSARGPRRTGGDPRRWRRGRRIPSDG